ncbi:MAG: hypothetical protein U0324_22780 [Polyangiales bacterium]
MRITARASTPSPAAPRAFEPVRLQWLVDFDGGGRDGLDFTYALADVCCTD